MNRFPALILALVFAAPLPAADRALTPAPVAEQVKRWRQFLEDARALQQHLVRGRSVNVAHRIGGYARHPEYYAEETYTDRRTGRVIARVQRVRASPGLLHSIEVFIHDSQGRVVRDYSAWYLPEHRNAPWSATVSLYAYPPGLTAFRSFDASDHLVQEVCRGRHAGQPVEISLDEFERLREEAKPGGGILGSPLYRLCFRGLPLKSAGRYLKPQ